MPQPATSLVDFVPLAEQVGAGSSTAKELHPRTPVLSLDDVNFMLGTGLSANMLLHSLKAQSDGELDQRDAWAGASVGGLLNSILARRQFPHRRGEGALPAIGKTVMQSGLPGAAAGAALALAARELMKQAAVRRATPVPPDARQQAERSGEVRQDPPMAGRPHARYRAEFW